MILFGPIPSRRLGRSLGINNIPPKCCSYSCVYCQIGRTDSMRRERSYFYSPDQIFKETAQKILELKKLNEKVDYLSFVPDGEPTLDINLGKTIEKLKTLGIKIAVITNASLIWDEQVRYDLLSADWVSLKIDTTDKEIWHKIDRPHGSLDLTKILSGIKEFSKQFKGRLVTETMLVKGLNDSQIVLEQTASFIGDIQPSIAYILVPTRPPAENWVVPPDEITLNIAYQIFVRSVKNVELLTHSEGTHFTFTGDAEKDLISILAVHPMNKKAVKEFLDRSNNDWGMIDKLIQTNIIRQVKYNGNEYFIRNLGLKDTFAK
ncbi:MAG: radical SAM protein [bacterium]